MEKYNKRDKQSAAEHSFMFAYNKFHNFMEKFIIYGNR